MTLPYPTEAVDAALLMLRLMIGIVFFSGWNHVKDPAGWAQSAGMRMYRH
jgi:hypothetical protein